MDLFKKPAPESADSIPYYRDIERALTEPGCALCRLLDRDADSYIDSLLWDMVNDPPTREKVNRARGYCRHHAWMLDRKGGALGVSIIMQNVLRVVSRILQADIDSRAQLSSGRANWNGLRDALRSGAAATEINAQLAPQVECPICQEVAVNEKHYATTLLAHLDGPHTLDPTYRDSEGLCLAHLRSTLSQVRSSSAAARLIEAQQEVYQRLDADLSEFIRKNDYRFRGETFGAEEDSWLRALEAVSGAAYRRGHDAGLTQAIKSGTERGQRPQPKA